MASAQERCDFLREHIKYEWLMLRFTHEKIGVVQDQMVWNAMYELFVVHARNLFDFLTNDAHSENMQGSDYNPDFQAKDPEAVRGVKNGLNPHVLHLGKVRKEADRKPHIDRLSKLFAWLDQNLIRFGKELPAPFSAHWPSAVTTTYFGLVPNGTQITQSSAPIQYSHPMTYSDPTKT